MLPHGDQGAVFAQAVTGNEGRLGTALFQPQAPQCDGRSKDRRLGLVGLVKLLFRAVLDQLPQVVAERFGRFLEGFDDHWLLGAELGEHAQRLGTLTGKDECEGCRH